MLLWLIEHSVLSLAMPLSLPRTFDILIIYFKHSFYLVAMQLLLQTFYPFYTELVMVTLSTMPVAYAWLYIATGVCINCAFKNCVKILSS